MPNSLRKMATCTFAGDPLVQIPTKSDLKQFLDFCNVFYYEHVQTIPTYRIQLVLGAHDHSYDYIRAIRQLIHSVLSKLTLL